MCVQKVAPGSTAAALGLQCGEELSHVGGASICGLSVRDVATRFFIGTPRPVAHNVSRSSFHRLEHRPARDPLSSLDQTVHWSQRLLWLLSRKR